MEYLIMLGQGLKNPLQDALGRHAPFFFEYLAPAALGLMWIGSVILILLTWIDRSDPADRGGSLFFKLSLTGVFLLFLLSAGAGLEFLILGGGSLHAEVLGGALGFLPAPE
jgi:hypothetical protein